MTDHEHSDLAMGIALMRQRMDQWWPEFEKWMSQFELKWDARWASLTDRIAAVERDWAAIDERVAQTEHKCRTCDPPGMLEWHRQHERTHEIAQVRSEALLTKRGMLALVTITATLAGMASAALGIIARFTVG